MKSIFNYLFAICVCSIVFGGCKEDEVVFSPAVPFRVELNSAIYHNGDSLYGRVIVIEDSLVVGMNVKKIDCRLGNIVIGTVENQLVCPFGMRLKDKPIGTHTLSVIIKCEAPDCDETFWRTDYDIITIKE